MGRTAAIRKGRRRYFGVGALTRASAERRFLLRLETAAATSACQLCCFRRENRNAIRPSPARIAAVVNPAVEISARD